MEHSPYKVRGLLTAAFALLPYAAWGLTPIGGEGGGYGPEWDTLTVVGAGLCAVAILTGVAVGLASKTNFVRLWSIGAITTALIINALFIFNLVNFDVNAYGSLPAITIGLSSVVSIVFAGYTAAMLKGYGLTKGAPIGYKDGDKASAALEPTGPAVPEEADQSPFAPPVTPRPEAREGAVSVPPIGTVDAVATAPAPPARPESLDR